MTTFSYSAPQSGSNFAFSFSVTGTLQSVTQPDASNNPQTVSGYVLTSATGTINGESVTLYTGGTQQLYDEYKIGIYTWNNIIKTTSPGDGGTPVVSGVDWSGVMLQSATHLYNFFGNNGGFQIEKADMSGARQAVATYPASALTSNAPCYVTGTRLRTDRGEKAIEDLVVGDRLVTVSGEARPIIWIGRRTIDCAGADSRAELPICVRKGALGPGLPARDLFVSPHHALHFDGVLIAAERLVNGATITRESVPAVTYWHVELESHDVVFAEGAEAETYFAAGNRHWFEGETDHGEPWGVAALPVLTGGERVLAVRRYLRERAKAMGGREIVDPALQLVADGEVLTPASVAGGEFLYRVPDGASRLRLRSHAAAPGEVMPEGTDERRLGVSVLQLVIDGAPVTLDDETCRDGWHRREGDEASGAFRWTDGDAALPLGREIELRLAFMPHYGLRLPPWLAPVVRDPAPWSADKVVKFASAGRPDAA